MSRRSYTLLLYLLAPLIWTWMALRVRKAGGRWGILGHERFGRFPDDPDGEHDQRRARVWVHAVSLGETRAAQPLIQALLDEGFRLLLTHTTATGKAEAIRLFPEAARTGQLTQAWLPYDFPGAVRGFLRHFSPRCGILIEREVWPNLIHTAHSRSIPMLLVSARFSASALRQAGWLGKVMRTAYATLDLVAAQTPDDARRLKEAGAVAPRVLGNLKFDVHLPEDQIAEGHAWHAALGRPVICLASTREGEEALFLAGLRETSSTVSEAGDGRVPLFLIVPRHPQRFDEVAGLLQSQNIAYVRRSTGSKDVAPQVLVMLGDSLGEMSFYYSASDVAIIGGGFAPFGGQNLIEAGMVGTPIIVGPHMNNFAQATKDALAEGAAFQATDADEALRLAAEFVGNSERRNEMRSAAQRWTAGYSGATERVMHDLTPWLGTEHRVNES
ncbi:3-deoxy-D-manno-octulosonic acid transferase [Bordetella sp. N]|uniref:3-deoxy-D-manno-octulosonic acid transferase n=1 Tax=Bordetella sp. N TaxID=1746199 RepID=UPI00070D9123|nr:3-deoxy-D-manno-octulosonic acid transferase [Bordetella sp. N]ALM85273.1 3-deoxy-D-manno-octulosonic acid transferase [Bordetella sp. N]